ncbi:hypothetical protein SMICM17S_06202 [Streptomyces microflavus]
MSRASRTPVLLSRDGLRLLDSEVDKDWADELSAALSGVASIASNITGPSHKKRPARQVVVERDDCLFFVQSAGQSAAFGKHPGNEHGLVDTVLAVIAATDADAGNAGFDGEAGAEVRSLHADPRPSQRR